MSLLPMLRPRSAIREFLRSEASGGIVLIAAAVIAMLAANTIAAPSYAAFLHLAVGPTFTATLGPMTVHHWINDGAMAVFFLLVGLEVKREWRDGHLARWSDRVLPGCAALAGMVAPACVYLLVVRGDATLTRGWAIPAATDIAFAIGVLALVGRRAPTSLKLFLTTVAIVDDMGAVAIIALGYTASIDLWALAGAAATLAIMYAMGRQRIQRPWPYLIGFAVLWYFVLLSGVHATVAGVLAAMAIPIELTPGAPDSTTSLLHRLEHALQPWVAYAIVPLFGFANAGVSLAGVGLAQVFAPLPLGIAAGLFIGKQVGVFGAVRAAVVLGLAKRPTHASWPQVYAVSLLCGVGFTMSLFIGGLAFADEAHRDAVKIGVLMGSIASALLGYVVLRFSALPDARQRPSGRTVIS